MPQKQKANTGLGKNGRGRGRPFRRGNRAQVERFAGDAYSLGARALAGVRKLASMINIEYKYFSKYTSTNITNAPIISCQSLVPQGVAQGNRVGESIKLQSISFQFVLNCISASTINNLVRVMLVRDLENPGVDFVATDLFTLSTTAYISDLVMANSERFTVLYDKSFVLSYINKDSLIDSFTKPMQSHIKYRGSATSSASNAEGALYLVVASNAASNYPTIESNLSFTYTDD